MNAFYLHQTKLIRFTKEKNDKKNNGDNMTNHTQTRESKTRRLIKIKKHKCDMRNVGCLTLETAAWNRMTYAKSRQAFVLSP